MKEDYTELDDKALLAKAKHGDPDAQAELATRLLEEEGYAAQGLRWARKAADQNQPDACMLLGEVSEDAGDVANAMKWYCRAAKAGCADGHCSLGFLYQQQQQYDKAWQCYEAAAEQGEGLAYYNMATMCQNGEGRPQDLEKAFELYQKGAQVGSEDAMCSLAECYDDGMGCPQDPAKAAELYEKAADAGQLDALLEMGRRLQTGSHGKVDLQRAVQYFSEAAELYDSADAMMALGYIYENPYGAQHDYEQAMSYYQAAWQQGDVNAAHEIGVLYFTGRGVKRDEAAGWKWIKKAAASGEE